MLFIEHILNTFSASSLVTDSIYMRMSVVMERLTLGLKLRVDANSGVKTASRC